MNELNNVKVTISPDEYKAYISITHDPDIKLNLTELGPLLKQHSVIYGIKKDVLMIIQDRYKRGDTINNILIAEGIEPSKGIAPSVDYQFEFSSKPRIDPSGRINYREISKILNIQKDQLLAIKRKLKQPVDGMTVTGKRTVLAHFEDIPLHIGENIGKEEDNEKIYFRAEVDGALKFENNCLSVLPVLQIAEDVDFNVGNIHFKGDVKIGRDVLPDFIVEVEGRIAIWGSAIACRLSAPDGVEVRGGIVGKNKGTVESGEDICSTFVCVNN